MGWKPKYMMEYSEDDFLDISGIQHFVFCRRQWALIHIEQQWQDDVNTTIGNIFHENAHNGEEHESRGNTLITRGLRVSSRKLGVSGICDIVEFQKDINGIDIFGLSGKWRVYPIEYKKGRPKNDDSDKLQLLAQGVCLEEMLECNIDYGYLYYGELRHREKVKFTNELRDKLYSVVEEMHKYYNEQRMPSVRKNSKCKSCSLYDFCMPNISKYDSARKYIKQKIEEK